MDPELAEQIESLASDLAGIESVLDLPKMRSDIADLEAEASAPDLWDDQDKAQAVTSRLSVLQGELRKVEALTARMSDLAVLAELAADEGDDDVAGEVEAELAALQREIGALEIRTLLSGEYDRRDALVSIRSGAGGVDAADWAEMLMRMYTRYCERKGWPVEVFDNRKNVV